MLNGSPENKSLDPKDCFINKAKVNEELKNIIIDAVVDDLNSNGKISNAIKGVLNVNKGDTEPKLTEVFSKDNKFI